MKVFFCVVVGRWTLGITRTITRRTQHDDEHDSCVHFFTYLTFAKNATCVCVCKTCVCIEPQTHTQTHTNQTPDDTHSLCAFIAFETTVAVGDDGFIITRPREWAYGTHTATTRALKTCIRFWWWRRVVWWGVWSVFFCCWNDIE